MRLAAQPRGEERPTLRGVLAGIGATALLVASACASAEVAPPAPPSAPGAPAPRLLLDETFARGWPDDQAGTAWFADGAYRLASRQPGAFVAVRAPESDLPRDVLVSGTFQKVGGPPGGGYGLILSDQAVGAGDGKDQSGQFVVAEVGDRGEIGMWRRDGTRWIDLVPWTRSSAVHTDTRPNMLRVQVVGEHLTFVVNEEQVADLPTASAGGLPSGRVGLFAGGDLNEVAVSRFRVQSPAVRVEPPTPSAVARQRTPDQAPVAQAPAGQPSAPDLQHMRDLLVGIADDVGAIGASFTGGPDDPHGPVSDRNVLGEDQARLAAASAKATSLLAELRRIQPGALGGR